MSLLRVFLALACVSFAAAFLPASSPSLALRSGSTGQFLIEKAHGSNESREAEMSMNSQDLNPMPDQVRIENDGRR
jgi:hypothetical protein